MMTAIDHRPLPQGIETGQLRRCTGGAGIVGGNRYISLYGVSDYMDTVGTAESHTSCYYHEVCRLTHGQLFVVLGSGMVTRSDDYMYRVKVCVVGTGQVGMISAPALCDYSEEAESDL